MSVMESSKEGKHCYVNSLAVSSSNLNLKVNWSSPTLVDRNGDYITGLLHIQDECKHQTVDVDQVNRDGSELEKQASSIQKQYCCKILSGTINWIPQSVYDWLFVFPCLALGAWTVIFSILGPSEACAGGSWLCLLTLIASAIVLGKLTEVTPLPPAVGMLTAGLILRNTSYLKLASNMVPDMIEPCRALAVMVLLVRGALTVNPAALRKYKPLSLQLWLLPFFVESTVFGTCAYYFLKFSLSWSIMTGFMVGTMSGGIVASCVNSIQAQIGKTNDAIGIAKASSGLDAIVGICLSMSTLGFIISNDELYGGFQKGPLEVIVGGVFAVIWGCIVGVFFNGSHDNGIRTFAVFSGGTMSQLGLQQIGFPRGGSSGSYFGTLIVAAIWRQKKFDGLNNDRLQENFTGLWFFFQPLLFALLGYRTDLNAVDWTFLWKGALCMILSLAIRVITAATLTTCLSSLSWKQRVFIALSWIPEGTNQAALGSVALDAVTSMGFDLEQQQTGSKVMHLCVLSVFMTSLGHICLALIGRRLLSQQHFVTITSLKTVTL